MNTIRTTTFPLYLKKIRVPLLATGTRLQEIPKKLKRLGRFCVRTPDSIIRHISQMFASKFNDDKKTLAFSDNVQDAAHRAGFFNSRTWRFGLRILSNFWGSLHKVSALFASFFACDKENVAHRPHDVMAATLQRVFTLRKLNSWQEIVPTKKWPGTVFKPPKKGILI